MALSFLDWSIIGFYLLFTISISLYFSRRASQSTTDFFLSGRDLPWWIAGTTMVATTFAADTPLAVTELIAQNGIAGNWLWWNMLFGGMFTVFFFARFWRRSGILTDVELTELRYSGKPAAFLRGFRALYLGVVMNTVIMGWVNLAMVKILNVLFPGLQIFGHTEFIILGMEFSAQLVAVAMLLLLVALLASMSGLWGVAITDVFQFTMAMVGSIALAVVAVRIPEVGGIAGLREKLPETVFNFTPSLGGGEGLTGTLSLSLSAFIAYLGVQWWASWYPGAEPGGGGYVAQRMLSAKDEKHSLFATLWFIIAHYAVRPWPWILVALVSLVVYPDLPMADKGEGFVMIMRDYLPTGLLGLMLAAFLAAYMSTISTQLNWGTSYVVNDFYRRFIRPESTEKDYVRISRIVTLLIMLVSIIVTANLTRISDAWIFIIEASAGVGLVLMLRWFWWRINAWSEIAAMVAPIVILPLVSPYLEFPDTMFTIVGLSTVIWLSITFITKPTEMATLEAFYRKIHPGGPGWKPLAQAFPDVEPDKGYGQLFIDWIAGCILVISALLGVGWLLLGFTLQGVLALLLAGGSAWMIYRHLSSIGWENVGE